MFIKLTDGTVINSDKITSIAIFDRGGRNIGFEATCLNIRFDDSGIIINASEEDINYDYERLLSLLCVVSE